jgi:hypothetical protein
MARDVQAMLTSLNTVLRIYDLRGDARPSPPNGKNDIVTIVERLRKHVAIKKEFARPKDAYAQDELPLLIEQIFANLSIPLDSAVEPHVCHAKNDYLIGNIPSAIGHIGQFCSSCLTVPTRRHLHDIAQHARNIVDEYNLFDQRRLAERCKKREMRLYLAGVAIPPLLSLISVIVSACFGHPLEEKELPIISGGIGMGVGVGFGGIGWVGFQKTIGKLLRKEKSCEKPMSEGTE